MMRSMFSGVSGLRTHQSRMDVIAHNIANVNTTGFKASRMTFADAFSQTIRGASAANPDVGRGGTNPMQVGLGVNVHSIQRQMSTGAAQRTDDPLHLMIEGDGFFVVGDDVSGHFFTRAGDFIRDAEWNIMAPNGMLLQGWRSPWGADGNPFDAQGNPQTPRRGPVNGIHIDAHMRSVPPRATGNIRMHGNLRYTDATGENADIGIVSTINFQDSLGENYSLEVRFIFHPYAVGTGVDAIPANSWSVEFADVMVRTADDHPIPMTGWTGGENFRLMFNENGNPADPSSFVLFMNLNDSPAAAALPPGVYFGQYHRDYAYDLDQDPDDFETFMIRLDFSGMTQHAGNTNVRPLSHDGIAPGNLIGLSIGADGILTGTYSNGQSFPLWQIAIWTFENPAGLAAMGNNLFAMTTNSGVWDGIGMTPGAAGTQLLGGTLEMSNVDLAMEFTEMITTQRGFQANSRIISTSDEMLQELVNLRR